MENEILEQLKSLNKNMDRFASAMEQQVKIMETIHNFTELNKVLDIKKKALELDHIRRKEAERFNPNLG